MAKALPWKHEDCERGSGTYAWVNELGLHYYAELDDGEWLPCLMVAGDEDFVQWDGTATRSDAEAIMQADFDQRVAAWCDTTEDRPHD